MYVNYNKKDDYTAKVINYLSTVENKTIINLDTAATYVPRGQIDFKDKITHSSLAYFFGLRLFKKGSSARKKLKGKI